MGEYLSFSAARENPRDGSGQQQTEPIHEDILERHQQGSGKEDP